MKKTFFARLRTSTFVNGATLKTNSFSPLTFSRVTFFVGAFNSLNKTIELVSEIFNKETYTLAETWLWAKSIAMETTQRPPEIKASI